jgi:hypothetical protein
MYSTKLAASIGLATTIALTGCSGSGKSPVSFSARASAETAVPATTPATTGLKIDDHVTLTRVRIVIRDVKLESHAATGAGTTTTTTTTSHPDDSAPGGVEIETETETEHAGEVEVAAGPILIDLKADALTAAKLQEAIAVTLPDGTYDELKLKIHKLEDGEKSGDADVDAARASVILDGTFDGKDFHFVSQLSARQKMEGSFTVGGATPSNITLAIDVTGWFGGAAGALDPSLPANQQAIEQNIKSSLRAFEDDDHDGHDDGEHRAGDDHGGGTGTGGTSGGGHDDGANHT